MSTVPSKYQPSTRLIDDPDRLRKLYCEKELSVREIAEHHATVGKSMVGDALTEYDITRDKTDEKKQRHAHQSDRGVDPPSTGTTVDWSAVS